MTPTIEYLTGLSDAQWANRWCEAMTWWLPLTDAELNTLDRLADKLPRDAGAIIRKAKRLLEA